MARKKANKSPIEEEMNELLPKKENPFDKIKLNFKCKNKKQKEYFKLIHEKDVVICTGCQGVGKSLVACAAAVDLIKDKDTPYEKIVFMVPPVQTSIEIGYIKGDINQKLEPFAYSYLYNLADLIGGIEKVNELVNSGYIEIMCVSFARGLNLKNSIVIFGEAQQYDKEAFLTLITRICETSKGIFEGDVYQCSNKYVCKGKEQSGLKHATECLQDIPQIGFITFDKTHVVRNPLITTILSKWDPGIYGYLDDEDVGKNAHDLENDIS